TALQQLRRFDEARVQLEKALALRERYWGHDHWEVAQSLGDLAALSHEAGWAKEEEHFRRAEYEVREKVQPETHPAVARTARVLGGLLCDRGRREEGQRMLNEALRLGRVATVDSQELAEWSTSLALCTRPLGSEGRP
ncbi:MAG: tetratricopeptide repeat protein, partial [Thermoanaerobaculia bacterium]